MSKCKKNSDDQLSLFDGPSLNVLSRLKAAMRESLRGCRLSRDQIAEHMTETAWIEGLRLPGNTRVISKAILDKWVSESSPHIIPLPLLTVFCAVTNAWLPIHVLARALGLTLIDGKELKILRWAQAELERRGISEKAIRLLKEIDT